MILPTAFCFSIPISIMGIMAQKYTDSINAPNFVRSKSSSKFI